jgi:hypothetical protein
MIGRHRLAFVPLSDATVTPDALRVFHNAATGHDQRFPAAASHLLRSPPEIGRRRILSSNDSGTGDVGRGGRNCGADAAAARCRWGVHGKHPARVSLAEDRHPVGDLGVNGQYEAFGETARRGLSTDREISRCRRQGEDLGELRSDETRARSRAPTSARSPDESA